MSKKLVRTYVLSILISCLVVMALVSQTMSSQLLNNTQVSTTQAETVHNLDTGLNYTTIQGAIDAPETLDGHTIFVEAGTYYESVKVNKAISLIGEDKDTTVIDGVGSLIVLAIGSDGVFVSGFTVMHSYGEPGGGGGGLVVGEVGNVQISDIIACYNDADWGVHLVPNSHDINITRTVIANNSRDGLLLHRTWKVNAYNNTVINHNNGIKLMDAHNNSIYGNNVTNNNNGIGLEYSSNNSIFRNTITANNGNGISANYGNNNSFFNNTVIDNYVGFSLQASNNNTLSGNQMTNNTFNFAISGSLLPDFLHDIDSSNTVNEKPLYYWVNEENQEIPNDAGYVAVVNSRNITVQDLNLTHNAHGVLFAYTTNSTVKNVTAEFNAFGITLQASYNNTITNNVASNNVLIGVGIALLASHNNTLLNNVASNNALIGIALADSGGNILRNNTMTDNTANFGVLPGPTSTPSMFINDVDPSNTVDGKPVYYWVNQSDRQVPPDAGCVLIVKSTNITARDLNLTKNVFGVLLVDSTNSTIKNVTAQDNVMGIALLLCDNTLIEENNVTNNAQCGFIVVASLNSNLTQNRVSGNGFTTTPVIGGDPYGGFFVRESNTTTIANNTITNNLVGIALLYSHHNNVTQNNLTNNENGISLQYSNSNTLTKNNVKNSTEGVQLLESDANILILNNIKSNTNSGLDLVNSGSNTLRNNSLTDNQWNFGIWGVALSDFINDVDTSNTVNDNPIVYLVSQTDLIISPSTFSQVGCVVVVNSSKITVQGLTLANNYESLTFAYTNCSTITNVTATNNTVSIVLLNSKNNTISANTVKDNWFGPLLGRSNDNKLINNRITSNVQAIGLFDNSHNNTLVGNLVKNNSYGIYLSKSEENTFYHNNFINNTNQADINESPNSTWDNGLEGNYWSNYIGVDANQDGIGDFPQVIDKENQDNYPLMGMFSSFNTSLGYSVNVISNSTIEDFEYFESNSTIRMYVSNMTANQTFGFCRICIRHALMDPDNVWIVIDGGETEVLSANFTLYDNITHRWIYFAYEHSTHKVDIIPEFPSFLILPLFMMVSLLVIVYKRKHTL